MRAILRILLAVLTITACGAAPLIHSGHQGSIHALYYDQTRKLLISGGEDGTLRIWQTSHGRLSQLLRVSHLPIRTVAVHPKLSLVAVLEELEQGQYRISVWNWQSQSRLYSIDLEERPLFLAFSSLGRYLMYSLPDRQSLRLHESLRGTSMSLLRDVYGIVSFFTLSASEKNLMIYQPSGWISYWRVDTGKSISEPIPTRPGLTHICLSENKTFIAAKDEDRLVMVDLLTGKLLASVALPNILSLSLSPESNRVYAISEEEERIRLSQWLFTGSNLFKAEESSEEPFPSSTVLSSGSYDLYIGTSTGSIWHLPSYGDARLLSWNNILAVSDIAVSGSRVALASAKGIHVLSLEENLGRWESPITDYTYEIFNNPFEEDIGLDFIDEETLVIWCKAAPKAGLLSLANGEFDDGFIELSSPLLHLEMREGRLHINERNGLIKVLDTGNLKVLFEYPSPGMHQVVPVGDEMLVGARSRVSQYQGSLLRIDTKTGETVPLSGRSLLSYELAYDPESDRLFSLSVDRNGFTSTTRVMLREGPDYEPGRMIVQYAGEDLSASLTVTHEGDLYTSIGFDSITHWRDNVSRLMAASSHIPRKLESTKRLLFSLNRDATVSVWDRYTRQLLLDFYSFEDLSWIAFFPRENAYLSHNADRHLNFSPRLTSQRR